MLSHTVLFQIDIFLKKISNLKYTIPNSHTQSLENNFVIPKRIFKEQNLNLMGNVYYQIDLTKLVLHSFSMKLLFASSNLYINMIMEVVNGRRNNPEKQPCFSN